MVWIAIKLRANQALNNPTIVIVTDRTDLDSQIHGTFRDCGFPNPKRAGSASELKELLSKSVGNTVMTTVQKFQDAADIYPVLTEDSNVFVLVDEAHRTQYRKLAANMRNAIKNGIFIGFTGTPIFKKDRDTFDKFGPYIDKYDHNASVRDGVTVPILYEDRMPEMNLAGNSLMRSLTGSLRIARRHKERRSRASMRRLRRSPWPPIVLAPFALTLSSITSNTSSQTASRRKSSR